MAVLDEGHAPLAYHEHDPVYTWVFESCATAVEVLRAVGAKQSQTQASRGIEHERVTQFLKEMSDPCEAGDASTRAVSRRWLSEGPPADDIVTVFENAGHAFAVRNILVQRTWREFEEKIRATRPVRG
ncbi:MAG: hypothetical protein H7138_18905 [Myxococcales bacterium]|nr:hypothetical protein [Myxococcales bacterium]